MSELKLIKPKNLPKDNEYLWKYIDIHRFLTFIWQKRIRFTRMDQFEDPLEGIPYEALNKYTNSKTGNFLLSDLILHPGKYFMEKEVKIKSRLTRIFDIQTNHYISCWFSANRESVAMWNLYSNEDGVSLKIPFGNLKSILKPDIDDFDDFFCGEVNYQDFRNIDPFTKNAIRRIDKVSLRKDMSFSYENELRFVVKKNMVKSTTGIDSQVIDLSKLDFEVICHPRMSNWKRNNIKQALNDLGLVSSFKTSEIKLRM